MLPPTPESEPVLKQPSPPPAQKVEPDLKQPLPPSAQKNEPIIKSNNQEVKNVEAETPEEEVISVKDAPIKLNFILRVFRICQRENKKRVNK